jgi:hypothetical protein
MTAHAPTTALRMNPRLWHLVPELQQGLDNLRSHTLRSLLTMLGMIFGVAAVVAMLSIGAGARQEVIAFIEQLGVRNIIVESRETSDRQALQRIRKLSAGLSFQDLRVIEANLRLCFPELSDAEREALARASLIETVKAYAELGAMWRWPSRPGPPRSRLVNCSPWT